ncbi:flagellar hook protein FlgE [Vallitalea guaymasensis]|uniref:flagellar hook protein FlgE n=1 Tax=Vallitalea guaymasensis TaxID=1185412 RepID=UPI000DE4075D|nr:flagellar hook protein FlgE [Vallitalea guaymasensis]
MMRSMYSGVSGLRIHQTRMDVIGNNIANVNTTGFKSGRVTFNEIFSQTLQGASGASESIGGRNPMQVGLGANISSIDTLMTEGAAQRTDNPLDMKIQGDGFFILKSAGGFKFSRAGAFRLDEVGNLVNPEGLNVMGWQPDAQGNIVKEKVSKIQILKPENVYSEPTRTGKANFAGNINKNDDNLKTGNGGIVVSFSIYDSQGYKYTVDARINKHLTTLGTPPTSTPVPDQYDITIASIKDDKGNSITCDQPDPKTIKFDTDGKLDTTGLTSISIKNIDTTSDLVSADFAEIEIDLKGLTQFGGKTTVEGVAGDTDGLDAGNPAGAIAGFDIGPDGKILGKYTNDQTKLLGQIAVAKFQNPAGLQKAGNNLFEVTNNSGEFDGIGVDPTADGGSLNGGVLEMSNVDLSREFTDMITTQRGFQANSRIITASDEMLQELVNLKR